LAGVDSIARDVVANDMIIAIQSNNASVFFINTLLNLVVTGWN
jgi:hypothetical protein